ncbi:HpcH/HpaI aldolase/citrate lyase family protein [Nocardia beijingensis]|uniref:HpcH/HpaI aldolase/citrate lyase family protein n=1 Tax=Nocardia beijingensis TaxID=95162 RepID=UPI0033F9B5AD
MSTVRTGPRDHTAPTGAPPGPATLDRVRSASTLLFVPADRPERFDKAAAAGAGLVVLDLEDAVAPDAKDAARAAAAEWVEAGNVCAVRINAAGTAWHAADLEALAPLDCAIMLPKADAGSIGSVVAALGADTSRSDPNRTRAASAAYDGAVSRTDSTPLIALIETAAGVLDARQIAATPGVHRLAVGTFDLAAELVVDPTDREALAGTRQLLVLASAAAGLPGPIDGVTAAVDDADLLTDDAAYGRRLGFAGKLCIHPRQLPPVTAAFRPTEADIAWARAILAATTDSAGVAVVDGAMVDKPVVDRAHRILDLLDRLPFDTEDTK